MGFLETGHDPKLRVRKLHIPNAIFHDARTNVYAGAKEQILKGFSNMPEILQAYP